MKEENKKRKKTKGNTGRRRRIKLLEVKGRRSKKEECKKRKRDKLRGSEK